MNTVKWPQSYDPTTAYYKLQSSGDTAIWTDLALVAQNTSGPNFNATEGLYFYEDPAGTTATWYRVALLDSFGQLGAYSEPMHANPSYVPTWSTAGRIINDAAIELGLGSVTDPFGSSDPNFVQLCALLKSLGRDLVMARGWSHLRGSATVTTVLGQQDYALPADFDSMIPQTWWNTANIASNTTPVGAEVWTYLNAATVAGPLDVVFRIASRALSIYPTTTDGEVIEYEYNRKWWVSLDASPDTLTSDAPAHSSDFCWFDPLLLVRGLKFMWRAAKGLDSSREERDYRRTLELLKSHDAPAPTLEVTGSRGGFRFINGCNVSDTGYGA